MRRFHAHTRLPELATDREMRCTLCRAEWCRHFVETSSRQAPDAGPQKSQMITIATAAAALSPSINLHRHATRLRDRGYTVIPDAGISADLVKDARAAVASEFSRLLDNLEELGIDAVDSSFTLPLYVQTAANDLLADRHDSGAVQGEVVVVEVDEANAEILLQVDHLVDDVSRCSRSPTRAPYALVAE